jgi:SOS-response transcriptional repressor LexA
MRMSRHQMQPLSLPIWAKNISGLRGRLGLTQTIFGHRLSTSAMSVSRWERGLQEPSADVYISLGKLEGKPLCWYFWERAGLGHEDLTPVIPKLQTRLNVINLEVVNAGAGTNRSKLPELVAVPLLKIAAASHGENVPSESSLHDAPVESMIAVPRDWCPNPATTRCLRVKGNSMKPLIYDGYVLVVDTSQTDHAKLDGKIVIAWHRDKGLSVSRLQAYDHTEVLRAENTEYDSVVLAKKHPWRVIAKVLWWIAKAP